MVSFQDQNVREIAGTKFPLLGVVAWYMTVLGESVEMVGYMRCLRALWRFLVAGESCCIVGELAAGLILWGYQKFK